MIFNFSFTILTFMNFIMRIPSSLAKTNAFGLPIFLDQVPYYNKYSNYIMTETKKFSNQLRSQRDNSLKQYKSFQDFNFKIVQQSANQRKIIKFSLETQKEELQKLQWRKKTEFPIVKLLSYIKLNNSSHFEYKNFSKKVLVQLKVEPIFYTLSEVDEIPILKVFYLLKQIIVGTERLCNFYGNFVLKSSMVAIDSRKRCKVWHNPKFHINKPEMSCQSQKETVGSIVEVLFSKTKVSLKSIEFYKELEKCETFCECLMVLRNFTMLSQTKIPSFFMLVDKFSSNMCSPRKYISRPPSAENNPQSPSTNLQKVNRTHLKNHKMIELETQRSQNFCVSRDKVKSLAGIVESSRKKSTFRNIVGEIKPQKTERKIFTKYLNRDALKMEEIQSISPKSIDKMSTLFPVTKNKKELGVLESVLEGYSDLHSIHEISDQPKIRVFEPLPHENTQSSSKNDTVLCRSSISLERNIGDNNLSEKTLQIWNYEKKDEVIVPVKKENTIKMFYPMMKLIDKSFDESSCQNL